MGRGKALLRDVAARGLARLGVTHPERRARGRLTIVTFHRVLPEAQRRAYPFPGLAVTPEELAWHLRWLCAHYQCGTLADAHRAVISGARSARPWLAVTFDDGQLDNHRYAAPALAAAGIRASFFVPVAHIDSGQLLWHDRLGFALQAARSGTAAAELPRLLGELGLGDAPGDAGGLTEAAKALPEERRRVLVEELEGAFGPDATPPWAGMMGWDEIAELCAAGHEVGSHTLTHPLLPGCDDVRLGSELVDSRQRLEAELAAPVESFCYPNGDSDARVENAVRAAGYRRAVTTRWGINGRDQNPLALQRCDLRAEHSRDASGAPSSARLAWRLSGLHPGLG